MLSFEDEASVLYPFPPDEHPVTLYARGDPETRRNVILHHPEVNGFIFLHEGVISKGHFTKKITDFRCPPVPNRNIIAAVSGTPDEFTPFSVIESEFFTDALHFTDKDDEDQIFNTVSIFKFIEDNRKKIEIPNMFSTDTKAKHARLKAVPIILPTVRGAKIEEGPLDSEDVTLSLQANAIYEAWAALLRSDYVASDVFIENNCPRPRKDMKYATCVSLPLKVLFKSSHILHNPYIYMKKEVDDFILKKGLQK